jgi:hypothetical protein
LRVAGGLVVGVGTVGVVGVIEGVLVVGSTNCRKGVKEESYDD